VRVGIVGCGLIGAKRADALGEDELVGCVDTLPELALQLAAAHGGRAFGDLDELLAAAPEVVIVAVTHDKLADIACQALGAGAHVLVEKPAGVSVADVDRIATAAAAAGRLVKVGFNHRFHPGIARAVQEARSGGFGPVMFVRGLYGHGGRLGYDQEWRARPEISGGGEMVDQGMHLLDLCHWVLGPLPLHDALLRTNYWDMPVEDNAALILGERGARDAPWAMLHASWTEWKNMFSLEIYCRTGKLALTGLAKSYGPQKLRIYAMKPELGPPDLEEIDYPPEDVSWASEWAHFRAAIASGGGELLGDLESARYAWTCIEQAYGR
jgi:predicted dehydrogenase